MSKNVEANSYAKNKDTRVTFDLPGKRDINSSGISNKFDFKNNFVRFMRFDPTAMELYNMRRIIFLENPRDVRLEVESQLVAPFAVLSLANVTRLIKAGMRNSV